MSRSLVGLHRDLGQARSCSSQNYTPRSHIQKTRFRHGSYKMMSNILKLCRKGQALIILQSNPHNIMAPLGQIMLDYLCRSITAQVPHNSSDGNPFPIPNPVNERPVELQPDELAAVTQRKFAEPNFRYTVRSS